MLLLLLIESVVKAEDDEEDEQSLADMDDFRMSKGTQTELTSFQTAINANQTKYAEGKGGHGTMPEIEKLSAERPSSSHDHAFLSHSLSSRNREHRGMTLRRRHNDDMEMHWYNFFRQVHRHGHHGDEAVRLE